MILAAAGLTVTTLQFIVQLRTYFKDRKKRHSQDQQQHSPQLVFITYNICNHVDVHPTYSNQHVHFNYMHPAHSLPHPLHPAHSYSLPHPLQPLNLPYYHHDPISRSHSLPYHMESFSATSDSLVTSPVPDYDWLGLLGGCMEHLRPQQAPHNTRCVHETLGMRTGASPPNMPTGASPSDPCSFNYFDHWKSLDQQKGVWKEGSIAVVDMSKGNIDMFMKIGEIYYRNYRIINCNVAMFAYLFKEREVFSGAIKNGKLERCSREVKMVEMMGGGGGSSGQPQVQSTNSWTRLGIDDDSEDMKEVKNEQRSFIETVRGAVLGVLCCLYEDPAHLYHLNVDMETAHTFGEREIVRIDSHLPQNMTRDFIKRQTFFFSVFSFGDLHN